MSTQGLFPFLHDDYEDWARYRASGLGGTVIHKALGLRIWDFFLDYEGKW